MGGKFSRNKGRREEQQLVLALSIMGYKAERILRQYQEKGQPDVKTLHPVSYTFEMKSRRGNFKTIYDLYYRERDEDGVLKFLFEVGGCAVALSTNFKALLKTDSHFKDLSLFPPLPKHVKVYKRILGLREMKQDADFLVIRDNGKPRIYMKYWA